MATAALIPLTRKSRDKLTVAEVCEDLQIAQSTFYEWRTKGTGPRCIKLPNGQLRVRRTDLEAWLDAREDAARWTISPTTCASGRPKSTKGRRSPPTESSGRPDLGGGNSRSGQKHKRQVSRLSYAPQPVKVKRSTSP